MTTHESNITVLKKENRYLRKKKSGLDWGRLPLLVPRPDTIIDVGAGGGTVSLYRTFPTAHIVAVEPLLERKEKLLAHAKKYSMEIHQVAAGRERTKIPINIGEKRGISSLLTHVDPSADRIIGTRRVEVHRLDSFVQPKGRAGLRIDAEGSEPDVIEGAASIMDQIDWVVAEVSMSPRFKEDRLFAGVYDLLAPQGFIFRDILDLVRQREGDMRKIDAVFVRQNLLDFAVRDKEAGH